MVGGPLENAVGVRAGGGASVGVLGASSITMSVKQTGGKKKKMFRSIYFYLLGNLMSEFFFGQSSTNDSAHQGRLSF